MPIENRETQQRYSPDKTMERIIIACIGLIMFLEMLDGSALNTSLPQIAFSLHINPLELKSAMTVYLLAVGTCIPAAGWFADRYGTKRILCISMTGFLLSSLGCGLSYEVTELTFFRALQGIFGAFLVPVARLLIVHLFRERLGEITAKIASIMLLGLMLGPVVGGFITTFISWRFIFFINVPLGFMIIFVVYSRFPEHTRTIRTRFDSRGFVLVALAMLSLLATLDTLAIDSIAPFWKVMMLISAMVLAGLYFLHYKRLSGKKNTEKNRAPVIDLSVFKNKTYAFFSGLLFIHLLFFMSTGFISAIYLQTIHHYSALQSGLALVSMVLGTMLSRVFMPYIAKRIAVLVRLKMLFLCCVIILVLLSLEMLHFNRYIFTVVLFANGLCIGMVIPSIQQTIYSDLTDNQVTNGSVVNSTIQQLGNSFAIALVALILILSTSDHVTGWDTPLPRLSYAMVFWINSVCMAMGWLLLWKAPVSVPATQSRKESLQKKKAA